MIKTKHKVFHSVVSAGLILALSATSPAGFVHADQKTDTTYSPYTSVTDLDAYETNEIIIGYRATRDVNSKHTLSISGLSKKQVKTATVSAITDHALKLKVQNKEELQEVIDSLQDKEEVLFFEPVYKKENTLQSKTSIIADLKSNPSYTEQWAYDNDGTLEYDTCDEDRNPYTLTAVNDIDINLPEALELCESKPKYEAIVAVVDTGVMVDHEDLKVSIWVNPGEIPNNGIDDDGNGYIDDVHGWNFVAADLDPTLYPNGNNTYYNANSGTEDSHGTHCAGTIAAANNNKGIVGIGAAAGVQIMTVKVLGMSDDEQFCTSETCAKGYQYAIDNGASILSISLGGEDMSNVEAQAIANNPDALFVCAAGNESVNNDITPSYPANFSYNNIISVANMDSTGVLDWTSNYGRTTVDIAAPGEHILSTSTQDTPESEYQNAYKRAISGYEIMSGTSMATPMVSGVAGLLYACFGTSTPMEIRTAILESAVKSSDLTGKVQTGGRLDAYAAFQYLSSHADSGTYPTSTNNPGSGSSQLYPTNAPSSPVYTPTPQGTATPSAKPTTTPSAKPTTTPSAKPTASPTIKPTTTPTVAPTSTPSNKIISVYVKNNPRFLLKRSTTIKAGAKNADGICTYTFKVTRNGKNYKKQSGYSSSFKLKPKKRGRYVVTIKAKDSKNNTSQKKYTFKL